LQEFPWFWAINGGLTVVKFLRPISQIVDEFFFCWVLNVGLTVIFKYSFFFLNYLKNCKFLILNNFLKQDVYANVPAFKFTNFFFIVTFSSIN